MTSDQSENIFKNNFLFWNIFGIWEGKTPSKYYKFYSIIYLFITFFCYNILLTLNLIYTPRNIELLLREVIFYFTEIVVAAKILTVILMHDKIIEVLKIIDGDDFLCDYKSKDGVLFKMHENYKYCWKLYALISNMAYFSVVFLPIILDLIRGTESDLPICKYYFLSDEDRRSYYVFWFIYQAFGMYGHMMYNVNIDSFIAGLLFIAITQLRILNDKLRKLKLTEDESKLSKEFKEMILTLRLNSYLGHYNTILKYCKSIQEVLSTPLFFQFGIASIIICVVMCGFVMQSTYETYVFLVMYFFTMSSQIFVPGYLGAQLTYESEEIMVAAYNSEWIPRSESLKRNLRLLMQRASVPIMLSGLQMFPLSLATFTSIMKTAYSFFTLIGNFQE